MKKPKVKFTSSQQVDAIDFHKLNDQVGSLRTRFADALKRDPQKTPAQNQPILNQPSQSPDPIRPPGSFNSSSRAKRQLEGKKAHQIRVENFHSEQDSYFVKCILTPYLSQVYFSLIERQQKDYISLMRTKHYLNLPPLIGERIVKQINDNGDERIDHNEFVAFFIRLLMGSLEQKMLIAFRCYDIDDDQCISDDEIRIVLKNIPLRVEGQTTSPFQKQHLPTRVEYMNLKVEDDRQIDEFIKVLFTEFEEGIYFDEFKQLATDVSSELFLCIYDCIYQYVPCVRNFLTLRKNYINFLQSATAEMKGIQFQPFTFTVLMPPVTKKMQDRTISDAIIEEPAGRQKQKKFGLDSMRRPSVQNQSSSALLPGENSAFKEGFETIDNPQSFKGKRGAQDPPPQSSLPIVEDIQNELDQDLNSGRFPNIKAIMEADEGSEQSQSKYGESQVNLLLKKTRNQKDGFKTDAPSKVASTTNPNTINHSPKSSSKKFHELFASKKAQFAQLQKSSEEEDEDSESLDSPAKDKFKLKLDGFSSVPNSARGSQNLPSSRGETLPTGRNSDYLRKSIQTSEEEKLLKEVVRKRGQFMQSKNQKQMQSQMLIEPKRAKSHHQDYINEQYQSKFLAKCNEGGDLFQQPHLSIRKFKHASELREDTSSASPERSRKSLNFNSSSRRKSGIMRLRTNLFGQKQGQEENNQEIQADENMAVDGFQIPLKFKQVSQRGGYIAKMANGYYRNCYMVLKNSELYLYDDKSAKVHEKLLSLTPGVFVKAAPPITKNEDPNLLISNHFKLFPLKLFVGGRTGNYGVKSNGQVIQGVFTFFFTSGDIQNNWITYFEKATGNFNVKHFYTFNTKVQVGGQALADTLIRQKTRFDYNADKRDESPRAKAQKAKTSKKSQGPRLFALSPKRGAADGYTPEKSTIGNARFPAAGEIHFMTPDKKRLEANDEAPLGLKKPQAKPGNEVLGVGKSGSLIIKAVHKSSKKQVALKIIEKNGLSVSKQEEIRDMIRMYQVAIHPYVVQLEDSFESKSQFFLCFELHSTLSLGDYLREQKSLSEGRAFQGAKKIAQALSYLHDSGIVLRNLEANGILMTEESQGEAESVIPRIAHLNKSIQMGYEQHTLGLFGDIRYRAPEVVKGKAYDFKADAWSFGVLLYLMLSGKMPFDATSSSEESDDSESSPVSFQSKSSVDPVVEIENKILKTDPDFELLASLGCSSPAINLVQKLLAKEKQQRLTIHAALKHQWFKQGYGQIDIVASKASKIEGTQSTFKGAALAAGLSLPKEE